MYKLTALLLFTFLCGMVHAQNIFSALHLNEQREYKTRRPKSIIETNTFFNTSGKQVDRNIKLFDEAGMLLREERFDENEKLKERLYFINDTINKLILSRVFERWTQFGYSKETAYYTYNENKMLIAITHKNGAGNIISKADLICNEKGHPVELSLYDGAGNSFGKELAVYLYDKNKVVTSVVANNGSILSSDTVRISFITANLYPDSNTTYNSHGDITSSITKNLNGTQTAYEEEYTYDNFGNCTENKIYKVTIKANGKRKRIIDRIFRKEYSY